MCCNQKRHKIRADVRSQTNTHTHSGDLAGIWLEAVGVINGIKSHLHKKKEKEKKDLVANIFVWHFSLREVEVIDV